MRMAPPARLTVAAALASSAATRSSTVWVAASATVKVVVPLSVAISTVSPFAKSSVSRVVSPESVWVPVATVAVPGEASARRAMPCAACTRPAMASMPALAACSVRSASPTPSSTRFRSPARFVRDLAVENAEGLSRADATFRPVARRDWVLDRLKDVSCSANRLLLMERESVTSNMFDTFPCDFRTLCGR